MDGSRNPTSWSRWSWSACIWGGIALFDATETVFGMHAQGMHHNWTELFVTTLLSWLPWALVTPLVLRLGHRFPPTRLKPLRGWLAHLAASVSVNVVASAWIAFLTWLLNPMAKSPDPGPFFQIWLGTIYGGFLGAFMLYAAILAVGAILESRDRLARQQTEAARLSEQLSKAQLEALRRQIEPHFLFNTLNSIAGLIREKRNDDAVTMIAQLSEFLRHVVEDSNRQTVSLSEEMEFVQKYLDIQKVRFADRLTLSVDVPVDLRNALVPSLMLQPIVENAIKHGIAKRVQGGGIYIAAVRNNGMLSVSVCNDGPALRTDWETAASGVGISNVRTRLQGLYKDAGVVVRNRDGRGVEVCITLPFRAT